MKNVVFILAGIAMATVTGNLLAHGGGGGGSKTFEADAPRVNLRRGSSATSSGQPEGAPKMTMSVDRQTIRLKLSDAYGDPMDVDIAEAKAVVSSGGRISIVRLLPAGMNVLSGKGDFVSQPGMRVDVTLRLPGQPPVNKDFYPFQ